MSRWSGRASLGMLAAGAALIGLVASPPTSVAATGSTAPHWVAARAPLPADANSTNSGAELEGVACASSDSCVAVGEYLDTHRAYEGLLESRTGSEWRAHRAPLPSNAATNSSVALAAVACPEPGACLARGEYTDTHGNTQGVLEMQSGQKWTAKEAPLPAGAATREQTVDLNALTCRTVGHCVVAGDYVDAKGETRALLEIQSGRSWKALKAPLPAGSATVDQLAGLHGVSCPTTSWCRASGIYTDTRNLAHGMVEELSGGVWRAKEVALPAGSNRTDPNPDLNAIRCHRTGHCLMTGDYASSTRRNVGLLDVLALGVWRPQRAPLPANAGDTNPGVEFDRVSCPADEWCVAAGGYGITSLQRAGVLETYAHGKWSATQAPLPTRPTRPSSNIWAVSCAAAGTCMAVGEYEPTGKDHLSQGLIEARSGTSWKPTKAPLPANASPRPGAIVDSVSCPSVNSCTAVGLYYVTSTRNEALLETWKR